MQKRGGGKAAKGRFFLFGRCCWKQSAIVNDLNSFWGQRGSLLPWSQTKAPCLSFLWKAVFLHVADLATSLSHKHTTTNANKLHLWLYLWPITSILQGALSDSVFSSKEPQKRVSWFWDQPSPQNVIPFSPINCSSTRSELWNASSGLNKCIEAS